MTGVLYRTASSPKWVAMAMGSRLLIVPSSQVSSRIGDWWDAMRSPLGNQAVLDALTKGGISTAPAFALLDLPDEWGTGQSSMGLIVRGGLEIVVHTESTSSTVTGEGVVTWVEQAVSAPTGFYFDGGGSASESDSGLPQFYLEIGSALVSSVSAGARTGTGSLTSEDTPAVPLPLATPAPSPSPTPVAVAVDDPGITISDQTFSLLSHPLESEPESGSLASPGPMPADETGYDFLFGETVVRTVEDAAIRDKPESELIGEPPTSTPSQVDGDHDGRTSIGLSAEARRAARRARTDASVPAVARAPRFYLELADGSQELLNQTVIMGRAPSVSKVPGGDVPRLVTVAGPDQDISRSHVQFSVEGETVVVTDLHSRNGTMVNLPGRAPQQLRAGETTAIILGTVIDLGAGVTVTVREQ